MAGPCTSFVLNKDFTLSETFAEVSRYHFEDALFSLQAGVGLDIFMFTLDLRTEAGLSDLSPSSSFDMHHKTINLSLGFKLCPYEITAVYQYSFCSCYAALCLQQ